MQSKLHEVELQVHAVEELLKEKNIHMTAVQRETESHCNKARHAAQATATMQWRTRGKSLQQVSFTCRYTENCSGRFFKFLPVVEQNCLLCFLAYTYRSNHLHK